MNRKTYIHPYTLIVTIDEEVIIATSVTSNAQGITDGGASKKSDNEDVNADARYRLDTYLDDFAKW